MFRSNIKVLVVDDSVLVCKVLSRLLDKHKGIQVVGTVNNPYEAKDLIIKEAPDVLLLDLDMPKMDGLTFLKVMMKHHPMPVVVLSHLTRAGTHDALECANAGAVEVMSKPSSEHQLAAMGDELIRKIRAAAEAKVTPRPSIAMNASQVPFQPLVTYHPRQLILLGASTGGTEALKTVLEKLPGNLPGILIAQHIPPGFSKAFAERMDRYSAVKVKEACHGDLVRVGTALVAPGNYHMEVEWRNGEYRVVLNQDEKVFHQRPSVDKLFNSAVRSCGHHAVAALLTGMGKDGAEGLLNLKNAGSFTIAQDQETSVVYGMPKAAVESGAACEQLPLEKIASALQAHSRSPDSSACIA